MFSKVGLYTPQTWLMSITSQNKPIYTVTLRVHNRRFVTKNKGEPVQVKNDLKKRFFFLSSRAIKTSREASSQSPIRFSAGRELKDYCWSRDWGYVMKLLQASWVTSTNYRTLEKPNQRVWRVLGQPRVSQTKYQGPCGLSPGHQDLLLPTPVPRQAKRVEGSRVCVLPTVQCLMILFLTTGPLPITF